jgi:pimeloyl-ACP methyl ester carboxylesterase
MKIVKRIILVVFSIIFFLAILILIFRTPDIAPEKLLPKYTNDASRFFNIQGMQVHYRDEGQVEDSLPILLIHGTSSSLHTWDSLVVLLPEKRCIRLDLPGFGLTGPHPLRNYSPQNTNLIINELLQHLNVDSCIIAGNSLGGFIAWSYTLEYPRAKKMILIDAAGFNSGTKGKNLAFQLARIPVVNQLLTIITPRSIVRKSLEQSYGDPSKVTDELVNRYFELNCRTGNRQALLDRFGLPSFGDTNKLKDIQIPALILWGQKDQLIPVKQADKFESSLPLNQKIIYPELGHVPMEESPERVAISIRNWLKQ